MRTKSLWMTLIVLGLGTVACAETLTVPGTGASQVLLRTIAPAFESAHPGTELEIPDSIGSGGGVRAAGTRGAVLARVARRPKPNEAEYGLDYTAFARMPIVFVTHPAVVLENLSQEQTQAVFSGETTDWGELGAAPGRIRVVKRYAGESSYKELARALPGWADLALTDKSKITKTDPENVAAIASIPGAVGWAVLDAARAAGLNVLHLDGVAPEAPDYPVGIEFGMVYREAELTPAARALLDFLHSPEARHLIGAAGAVPVAR